MRNGLYLQGGGAKGAFQAGAIRVLLEKEIPIHVLAGTSIGAINGMILFYSGGKRCKELWYKMMSGKYAADKEKPVFETLPAVQRLGEHLGNIRNKEIRHFFVNYLKVHNTEIKHQVDDLVLLDEKEIYERVSASSRLPNLTGVLAQSGGGLSYREAFLHQIQKGIYDGYWLDGGLVNNKFMEPFLKCPVDNLYAIVFDKDFVLPEYLTAQYRKEQIYLIKPDFPFKETDTMAFSIENLEKWYQAGYESACKIL